MERCGETGPFGTCCREKGHPGMHAAMSVYDALIDPVAESWRSRCLAAEKKNAEYLTELKAVREELMELKYGGCASFCN